MPTPRDGRPSPPSQPAPADGRASIVKPIALLAVITGCLLAVYLSPLRQLLAPEGLERLRDFFRSFGAWTWLVFAVACALGVGIGAPRLAFAGLGGLLFGTIVGTIVAQIGTLLGCILAFGWARWLGRDFVQRRDSRRLQKLLDKIRRRPIATNVLLRVCPVGNAFATNLLFGVSPMTLKDFTIGTFLGTLPETLILALFGASIAHGSPWQLIAGAALMVALIVGYYVTSRRSTMASELEHDIQEPRTGDDPRAGSDDARAGSEDARAGSNDVRPESDDTDSRNTSAAGADSEASGAGLRADESDASSIRRDRNSGSDAERDRHPRA